ncbi:hypothetical protein [Streptomyces sioyaensis]|uniref:hypothetical protein n=1 Tax=Streptomyces sioyaensis TaxID=67364 RepID=UPI0037A8D836
MTALSSHLAFDGAGIDGSLFTSAAAPAADRRAQCRRERSPLTPTQGRSTMPAPPLSGAPALYLLAAGVLTLAMLAVHHLQRRDDGFLPHPHPESAAGHVSDDGDDSDDALSDLTDDLPEDETETEDPSRCKEVHEDDDDMDSLDEALWDYFK